MLVLTRPVERLSDSEPPTRPTALTLLPVTEDGKGMPLVVAGSAGEQQTYMGAVVPPGEGSDDMVDVVLVWDDRQQVREFRRFACHAY